MMPPMSGKQAMAAAILEGNPVELDLPVESGFGPTEGGFVTGDGGGWLGSIGSGIRLVTQNQRLFCQATSTYPFSLSRSRPNQYRGFAHNDKEIFQRFHPDRNAGRDRDHRHPHRDALPRHQRYAGAWQNHARHEQSAPNWVGYANVSE